MAKKYLDDIGLLYFWGKLKAAFVSDVTWDSTNKKLQRTKNGSTADLVTFATVATTGSYSDLSNKPYTGVSDVQVDGSSVVSSGVAAITIPVTDVQVDGTSVVSSGVAEISIPEGVFIAEYDVTSFSDLVDAYNAGKTIFVAQDVTNGIKYIPLAYVSLISSVPENFVFERINGMYDFEIVANSTGWGYDYYGIAADDVATTTHRGLMSIADKVKLDKLIFDNNDLIDSSILPSYVDDVIEAYPVSGATELTSGWLSKTSGGTALTPETGKIYVLMVASTNYDANTQFRWGGSAYVKLSDSGASAISNAEIDTIVAS